MRRFLQLRGGRRWAEDEVELEFRHHLEMRTRELIEEGWSPEEARREAETAFGDADSFRQACVAERRREARMTRTRELFGTVVADLRYALRGIRKQPGFAAAVVLTLGVGIGANAAIFTVVDHILIRDLPFEQPDELFTVEMLSESGIRLSELPRDVARGFDDLPEALAAVGRWTRMSAVRDDGPEPTTIRIGALEPGFTGLVGVPPALGRALNPDDAVPGAADAVLLGHAYWREAFGADPEVVGRTIVVDSLPLTVVGVVGRAFRVPLYGTTELYVPLASDGTALGREPTGIEVLTRLAPAERERTEEIVGAFVKGLLEAAGEDDAEWSAVLVPMNEPIVNADVRRALYVSLGAVTLMLLVAMVNGINLMLVRAAARGREIGVRLALGGSRARVVGQMTVESVLLAALSGAVAVAMAAVGVEALWGMAPGEVTFFGGRDVGVDGRVLGFVGALAAGSGLLFGLLPAWRAVTWSGALSPGSLGVHHASDRRRGGARGALIVGQVAVTLALLFGAGLLGRSFGRLVSQDPGMDPEGLVTMNLRLSPGRYPDEGSRAALVARLRERIEAIPGVTDVTVGGIGIPGGGVTFFDDLYLEGREDPVREGFQLMPFASADPSFRRTLRTRLLAGRDFTDVDRPADRTILATLALVRMLGFEQPGDAVGARFRQSGDGRPWQIVGVVEDVRLEGMDPRYGRAAMIRSWDPEAPRADVGILVRSGDDFGPLRDAMRAAVHEVDPGQPIAGFLPVEQALHDSVQKPRFFMTMMVAFAVLALFLAAVGLYGVLSFAVSRRAREMGIRVAVGAGRSDVQALVLRQGVGLAALGVLAGAVLSLAVSGVMEELLFDTSSRDAVVLSATAGVLLGAAALASWPPARRATRVDPVAVLKAE